MDAKQALISLSSLAADFKVGIVPSGYVVAILETIIGSMDVDGSKDELLQLALEDWGIEIEEEQ